MGTTHVVLVLVLVCIQAERTENEEKNVPPPSNVWSAVGDWGGASATVNGESVRYCTVQYTVYSTQHLLATVPCYLVLQYSIGCLTPDL